MDAPVVEEVQEHLQRAWRLLRCPQWPASLAETMTDPLRARLVRLYAQQLARNACAGRSSTTVPVAATRFPTRRTAPPPGLVDHKRAAAGDRDD